MPLPQGLPRPGLRRYIPPRRTRAEPPRDRLQDLPVITPPPPPPSRIRGQHRLDQLPQLIRDHARSDHSPIIGGTVPNLWETRPRQVPSGTRRTAYRRLTAKYRLSRVDGKPDTRRRPPTSMSVHADVSGGHAGRFTCIRSRFGRHAAGIPAATLAVESHLVMRSTGQPVQVRRFYHHLVSPLCCRSCYEGLSATLISSARPNFSSRVNSAIGLNGAPLPR